MVKFTVKGSEPLCQMAVIHPWKELGIWKLLSTFSVSVAVFLDRTGRSCGWMMLSGAYCFQ